MIYPCAQLAIRGNPAELRLSCPASGRPCEKKLARKLNTIHGPSASANPPQLISLSIPSSLSRTLGMSDKFQLELLREAREQQPGLWFIDITILPKGFLDHTKHAVTAALRRALRRAPQS